MTIEEIQQELTRQSVNTIKTVEWKVKEKYGLVEVECCYPDDIYPDIITGDSRLLPYSKENVTKSICARIKADIFRTHKILTKEDIIELRKMELEADFE